MKKNKAQSAIELFLLIGAVLFFTLGFMSIFQQSIAKKSLEKREFEMQELARSVQNEINIAAKSTDGYLRKFNIPGKIAGAEYSISLNEGYLYLNTTDGKHAMAIQSQNATGQLIVGATNTIRKINSTIFLN
ncbi:MAG: hypothetical protein KKD18_02975 [Nanoarchaeota archaeon]|nr:hypothetical protein [Nanoarchaeota archaeon]MBU0977353.1 hypothetical protein [Nanoarchaeota archaeon]